MFKIYQKDNMKLYAGVVEGEPRKLNRDGKTFVVFTLRDYKDEKIDIFFSNSDKPDAVKADMKADRVINAKVRDGSFLTVLALCSDEEEKTASGLDFKYRGRWNMKDGDKVTTVLMGIACQPREPRPGMYSINIPVDEYKDGETTTMWCEVTFFDGEKDGRTWENATFASKVLANQTKPMVIVAGTDITEREVNGKVYHSMIGFRISRKPD